MTVACIAVRRARDFADAVDKGIAADGRSSGHENRTRWSAFSVTPVLVDETNVSFTLASVAAAPANLSFASTFPCATPPALVETPTSFTASIASGTIVTVTVAASQLRRIGDLADSVHERVGPDRGAGRREDGSVRGVRA